MWGSVPDQPTQEGDMGPSVAMFSSKSQRNNIKYLNVFTDRDTEQRGERIQDTCIFPVLSKNVCSELLKVEAKLLWPWDAFKRNMAHSHPLYF